MTPRKQALIGFGLAFAVSVFGHTQAQATVRHHSKHRHSVSVPHHHHRHHHRLRVIDANGNRAGLITVPTAAGIDITVAPDFASPMQAFISDLVARGIHPRQIHCYSWAPSHRPNSLHHSGHACDFNGSANRYAAMNGHRVSDLARKYGLRDGCEFSDCGHIDAGRGYASRRHLHLAKR